MYLRQIINKNYEPQNEKTKEIINDDGEELIEEKEFDVHDTMCTEDEEGEGIKNRFSVHDFI